MLSLLALLLSLAPLAATAQPALTHGCGGWLLSSGGWRCHRLATNYELYFKSNSTGNGTTIYFGLDVWPTNYSGMTQLDWIGIGISEAGGMPGADIAVLSRDPSAPSGWVLSDMFAREFARPAMDARQDKTLLSVQEKSGGRVRARFSFPAESCDRTRDRPIRAGLQSYVIYAFGQGPFDYHGTQNRGEAKLTFIPNTAAASTGNSTLPTTPPTTSRPTPKLKGARKLDIFMPAIPIPTTDTDPYLCVDFQLPGTHEQPFHIIDFNLVINTTTGPNPSQDKYVHHVVLYNCSARPDTYGGAPYDCTGFPDTCQVFVLVAGEPGVFRLPEAAGFRIGAGAMHYVTLQIHYNNVNLDRGLVDSSGFTVTYTPQLRRNDMGVLSLGMLDFQIPPLGRWSTGPNVCPPGCMRRLRQNVTMVANLLHMHQTGVGMTAQHFRPTTTGNVTRWAELEPLAVRQYYDFKFQPYMPVPKSDPTLMPGDAIITTCNYTNPYNHTVQFGTRSSEEMCYQYLMYYPLVQGFTDCTESPYFRAAGRTLCEGTEQDEQLLEQLFSTYGPGGTAARQAAAYAAAVQAGVLASRNDVLASIMRGVPYADPVPSTCPAVRPQG